MALVFDGPAEPLALERVTLDDMSIWMQRNGDWINSSEVSICSHSQS